MSPANLLNSSLGPYMQVRMLNLNVGHPFSGDYLHVALQLNRSARCSDLLATIQEAVNDIYLLRSNGDRVYADIVVNHQTKQHVPNIEFLLRFELNQYTAKRTVSSAPIEIGCSHGEYRFSTTLTKQPAIPRNPYWIIDRATDIFRDKLAWIFVIAYVSSVWLLLPVQAA